MVSRRLMLTLWNVCRSWSVQTLKWSPWFTSTYALGSKTLENIGAVRLCISWKVLLTYLYKVSSPITFFFKVRSEEIALHSVYFLLYVWFFFHNAKFRFLLGKCVKLVCQKPTSEKTEIKSGFNSKFHELKLLRKRCIIFLFFLFFRDAFFFIAETPKSRQRHSDDSSRFAVFLKHCQSI